MKIFFWLLQQNRLWCNDRLQRRGWPNRYFCQCCLRHLETLEHLFWSCPCSLKIWTAASLWRGCHALNPARWSAAPSSPARIKLITQKAQPGSERQAVRSMVILVCWEIWQERNSCTFRNKEASTADVIAKIQAMIELWRLAGAKHFERPFGKNDARGYATTTPRAAFSFPFHVLFHTLIT
ncbi:hypothetical protein VPH35_035726 [Triticum aestivum]